MQAIVTFSMLLPSTAVTAWLEPARSPCCRRKCESLYSFAVKAPPPVTAVVMPRSHFARFHSRSVEVRARAPGSVFQPTNDAFRVKIAYKAAAVAAWPLHR